MSRLLDPCSGPQAPRRMEAQWPGVCTCGEPFDAGALVAYNGRVCGCDACAFTGQPRPARADMQNVRGGGPGVAAALRRREAKRRKEAARRLAAGTD